MALASFHVFIFLTFMRHQGHCCIFTCSFYRNMCLLKKKKTTTTITCVRHYKLWNRKDLQFLMQIKNEVGQKFHSFFFCKILCKNSNRHFSHWIVWRRCRKNGEGNWFMTLLTIHSYVSSRYFILKFIVTAYGYQYCS